MSVPVLHIKGLEGSPQNIFLAQSVHPNGALVHLGPIVYTIMFSDVHLKPFQILEPP